MAALPQWRRDFAMQGSYRAIRLAIEHRPEVAEKERIYLETIKRMHHQLTVAQELFGRTEPPEPVDARVSNVTLEGSEDDITVRFEYEGMEPGQLWFYRSYVDDEKNVLYSNDPQPWTFDVPAGALLVMLPQVEPGQTLRTEIYVEGHLLDAGEYHRPPG